MYRRSLIRSAAAAGLLAGASRAQSFPSGSSACWSARRRRRRADIVARIHGAGDDQERRTGRSWSTTKPGPAAPWRPREMLRAPADGHTLLVANVGVLARSFPMRRRRRLRPRADIAPVCLAGRFLQPAWSCIPACRQDARRVSRARQTAGGMDYRTLTTAYQLVRHSPGRTRFGDGRNVGLERRRWRRGGQARGYASRMTTWWRSVRSRSAMAPSCPHQVVIRGPPPAKRPHG